MEINKDIFSTKAGTLEALQHLLKRSQIKKLFSFTVSDWKNKKIEILKTVRKEFSPYKIVIRSSSTSEDSSESSMAGCFDSILNIDSNNLKQIMSAIKKVTDSYKYQTSESSFNRVLVQLQLEDIIMSGVIFTRTLETDSPYYIINYDDKTGETDTVTKGIENKNLKISKFARIEDIPQNMQNLIMAIKEIEDLFPNTGLDIEFAIDKNRQITIFQVRPLITNKNNIWDWPIKNKIDLLKIELKELFKKKEHLAGEENILADMPDWNPAEIIGNNPNYLDYSFYDYIITDSAWHKARTSQGYYDVNPAKLIILIGSKPYVNVRNSFNSFIPNSISKELREKLISFYFDKLKKNPEMQDKVEFEILHTCYDLCFEDRTKELLNQRFTFEEINELKTALINLTNNLIINSKINIQDDLNSLEEMKKNRENLKRDTNSSKNFINYFLSHSKILLDDCRSKGTVPFSRLARLSFIGSILLKSLVHKNIIDNEFYDQFMNSIETVATELKNDFNLITHGDKTKEDFIKKYSHLRPGTYDITSLRYDSNPDLLNISDFKTPNNLDKCSSLFTIDSEIEEKITNVLRQEGLRFNARDLFEFMRKSLEAREFAKFEFTKNLSDSLELIALAGEEMGFSREELSMLDVSVIFSKQQVDREERTNSWREMILSRKKEREISSRLELPPIIFSSKDLEIIKHYAPRPNYITHKKTQGHLIKIDKIDKENIPDIEGKIILIENADPGFDWIFTKNIKGLITKYGGVASHMSIRCAEFGIPAAIGCGILFDKLTNINEINLDCKLEKIIPIGV